MRIYIAGAGGMLGEALYKTFKGDHELLCSDIDVNEPWLKRSDFRDFADYERMVSAFRPDILMHVGAHTDLEYCELNPDDAYRTNTLAAEHAAYLSHAHGIPMVYIGTAGIFGGEKETFDDWDEPRPSSVYARSKYLGELAVQTHAPKHFIFRAGWMMGGGPAKDKKFVNKILKQLAGGARILHVVDDRTGAPTYTVDFANNMAAVIGTKYYGLYNMVSEGAASRLDVAREIVKLLKLESAVDVRPVKSDHFNREYFAPRPPSEVLVNSKLRLRSLDRMRNWRPALKAYLECYFPDYVKPFAPDFAA
jgi:dTDP-4-dehydrorhamnose reductase